MKQWGSRRAPQHSGRSPRHKRSHGRHSSTALTAGHPTPRDALHNRAHEMLQTVDRAPERHKHIDDSIIISSLRKLGADVWAAADILRTCWGMLAAVAL